MKKPTYKHVVPTRDQRRTYTIYAYRPLTRDEIVAAVHQYRENKFDEPRDGNIEIISMIGFKTSGGRKQ